MDAIIFVSGRAGVAPWSPLRPRVRAAQAPDCCAGSPVASVPFALIPSVFALAELNKGDTFVDIGCGSGKVVLAAAATQAIHAGEPITACVPCPPPFM